MLLAGTFTGLDPASRSNLSDWLASATAGAGASAGRIDTVIDLSHRPWKIADVCTLIGVFEKGKNAASWLIVGHRSSWTLLRCEAGEVSDTHGTLAEVLELIDESVTPLKPGLE